MTPVRTASVAVPVPRLGLLTYLAPAGHDDFGTGPGEHNGGVAADARRAAGDDRNLAVQVR